MVAFFKVYIMSVLVCFILLQLFVTKNKEDVGIDERTARLSCTMLSFVPFLNSAICLLFVPVTNRILEKMQDK